MPAIAGVRLHTVSVVVTANYHNPSILNNYFLVNNKIVPDNWNVVEAVSIPAVSVMRYGNGINWLVDQQRLDISKEYNIPFEDHADDTIHGLAAAYVRTLPNVPYRDIGLNCVVSIENGDPLQWMTQKFLKPESCPKDVMMVPQFIVRTGEAVLNFRFGDGLPQFNDKQAKSIVIGCNHHFTGPFKSIDDMLQILSGWKDTKNTIAYRLGEVLG